jgi:hypothetical protein
MASRRWLMAGLLAAVLAAAPQTAVPSAAPASRAPRAASLPAQLSNADFWRLVQALSEPDGFFRSDNLVSNEDTFQLVIPELTSRVKPGGVYLGVGPEQNFTYIAALKPRMVFIVDIRRGNLHMHLMYKALFELSGTRAEFLSRLFARPRPGGLNAEGPVDELFGAFAGVSPTEALYDATIRDIVDHLRRRRRIPLSDDDAAGIAAIYMAFYRAGPSLAYANVGIGGRGRYPTFRDLQTSHDGTGQPRAFLATEAAFKTVRTLHERNLIVPVVGDFAGPKTLRAVGSYVRERGAVVSVFYLSNVEQYLFGNGLWPAFADNVASMPLDQSSTFIRSCFTGCGTGLQYFPGLSQGPPRAVMLLDSMTALLQDVADGRIRNYTDVLWRSR